jgi:hypothetical protein
MRESDVVNFGVKNIGEKFRQTYASSYQLKYKNNTFSLICQ